MYYKRMISVYLEGFQVGLSLELQLCRLYDGLGGASAKLRSSYNSSVILEAFDKDDLLNDFPENFAVKAIVNRTASFDVCQEKSGF